MSALWTQNSDGVWVPAQLYPHNANGWMPAAQVFEKTSSTVWTQRWQADQTAPHAPTFSYTTNAQAKTYQLTITMPSDVDAQRMILKYSYTGYPKVPSSAPETGAIYYSAVQPDGTLWSEQTITPSQVITRNGTNVPPGQIYFSCWVQDTSGNWSAPGTLTFKQPAYTAPVTTTVNKSITLNCTDSGTWMNSGSYWRTDNNYVETGGTTRSGLWFFNGRISSALLNAKKITAMTIRIQRVNSDHGVVGGANVRLSAHTMNTQFGSPNTKMSGGVLVGTLTRGQTATFNVPSQWWPYFLNKTYKGLGLYYGGGDTPFTSPEYIHTYGAGTTSGQVHIEWQE